MKTSTWNIIKHCVLMLVFTLSSSLVFGQITVVQYNADWNDVNKVTWLSKLSDVDKSKNICIVKDPKAAEKHEIVVVPTIIIFKDGEEAKRYQADISFTIKATREEVQEYIDELLMQDF